jgi:hypothetical protein
MQEAAVPIPMIWYRWLHAAVLGLMLFGIAMIAAPGLIRQFFSALIYATPSAIESNFGAAANAYIVLVHGVLGAVMFGWSVAMLLALRGPFRRGEREGWLLMALPLVAWYVPDTLFSLHTGFWQNAVLNTALALLFAIPLAASRKHFRAGASGDAPRA